MSLGAEEMERKEPDIGKSFCGVISNTTIFEDEVLGCVVHVCLLYGSMLFDRIQQSWRSL